jgi:acetylornithine deacetylase
MIAFLQRIVRCASLPDREHEVQHIIADQLRGLGLHVDIVPTRFADLAGHPAFSDDGFSPDGRINVVGRWPGQGAGSATPGAPGSGSLLLQGHVDVVAPGDLARWRYDPWGGEIVDGRLFGRGSCDMKAGVTAGIFALAALRQLGYRPRHDILFESVIGEESGGVGALATIVAGYGADAALILEPTRQEVSPVQAGALTFRLTVQGKAIHAAMKSDGVSAIDKYLLLHQAIYALDAERHRAYSSSPYAGLYADPTNVAPISIGTVHGGEWHSTVAETVVAEGRCGIFPGERVDEVRRLLEATVRRAAADDPWLRVHPPQVEWFEGQFEAAETALDHPLLWTLGASHRQVHGRAPAVTGVPYGADMRLYTNHGHMAAVLYGPGDVTLAHAADEYVPLEEVIAVAKTVALTVLAWCGGELPEAGDH